MLLNSYLFLFLFLPITLLSYYLISKLNNRRINVIWLSTASLVFYSFSTPIYLALIVGSVLFNYAFGLIVSRTHTLVRRRMVLWLGLTVNIALLGYFKYTNFFISSVNSLFNTIIPLSSIILPLGISFFTLQQIAYLVDIYRGEKINHGFWEYFLFITFFPKLLAGPVVRIKQMMPQIIKESMPALTARNLAAGLTILSLGIFKKVVIADHIAAFVDPVFNTAAQGSGIGFISAWIGALGYSLQLYFDFSSYSDMAIGLGLMFSIKLPLNFYSPYKASSIIDFWHRWHITLSNFIRDYIYIPLGGNRRGFLRQMFYLFIAMAIAGLWHGAGWTFIMWGALHGLFLIINHGWRKLSAYAGYRNNVAKWWGTALSTLITFIAVTIAWVFFRADSVAGAVNMIKGMIGMNGFQLPHSLLGLLGPLGPVLEHTGITFNTPIGIGVADIIYLAAALFICWFLPNVQEYMKDYQPTVDSFNERQSKPHISWLRWKPSFYTATAITCLAVLAILGLSQVSKFIYMQF